MKEKKKIASLKCSLYFQNLIVIYLKWNSFTHSLHICIWFDKESWWWIQKLDIETQGFNPCTLEAEADHEGTGGSQEKFFLTPSSLW